MSDKIYMMRALSLSEKGMGFVSTNPMVGAVIVHAGKIIGEGYHQRFGEAHAEVNAIHSVKDKTVLCDSTLYVTLEPCCHHGKTPPCTDLILEHRIPNVVIAMQDPFAKVSGEGINILRRNGVTVEVGMLEEEAKYLNRRFITFHTKKRPYIILKWAETADGFIDSDRDKSEPAEWLTGKAAKLLVHRWRAEEDAIMVGANTVLRDNPQLTVRDWFGRNPLRVTIDSKGTVPKDAAIFDASAPTVCYNKLDIDHILNDLYQRNIQSFIVEGGMKTLQQFIDSGHFDEIRRFIALRTFDRNGVSAPKIENAKLLSEEKIGNSKLELFLKR